MTEVDVPVTYRQMLVPLAVVVVDVDVHQPVGEPVYHGVDLPSGVGVPDIEGHTEIGALDEAAEALGGPPQEERDIRHVLDPQPDVPAGDQPVQGP